MHTSKSDLIGTIEVLDTNDEDYNKLKNMVYKYPINALKFLTTYFEPYGIAVYIEDKSDES